MARREDGAGEAVPELSQPTIAWVVYLVNIYMLSYCSNDRNVSDADSARILRICGNRRERPGVEKLDSCLLCWLESNLDVDALSRVQRNEAS